MKIRLIALLFLLATLASSPALAEELSVIAHPEGQATTLSKSAVKKIYLGKTTRIGDTKARPLDRSDDGKLRSAFLKSFVGTSPKVFDRYWISKSYRDGASPPSKLSSAASIIRAVAESKAAIGFVRSSALSSDSNVKVIATVSF